MARGPAARRSRADPGAPSRPRRGGGLPGRARLILISATILIGGNAMADDTAIKWKKSGQAKEAKVEGIDVRIEERADGALLTVDDLPVAVERMPDGTYYTDTFQHRVFGEADDLVRALVAKQGELKRAMK
jgi:hypothetical protein